MREGAKAEGHLFGDVGTPGSVLNVEAWNNFSQYLWMDVENEMKTGECQGIRTLKDMWPLVQHHKMEAEIPLFRTIYNIAVEGARPSSITFFGEAGGKKRPQ